MFGKLKLPISDSDRLKLINVNDECSNPGTISELYSIIYTLSLRRSQLTVIEALSQDYSYSRFVPMLVSPESVRLMINLSRWFGFMSCKGVKYGQIRCMRRFRKTVTLRVSFQILKVDYERHLSRLKRLKKSISSEKHRGIGVRSSTTVELSSFLLTLQFHPAALISCHHQRFFTMMQNKGR